MIADLVDTLQRRDSSLKTIAIRVTGRGTTLSIDINAAHSRPQAGWLGTVRNVLEDQKVREAG